MAQRRHFGRTGDLIGLPADALEDTVARYNAMVAAGADTDFGRGDEAYDRAFSGGESPMVAIDTPPFHAAAFGLSDLGTKGGLRTDARARVLDESGEPSPACTQRATPWPPSAEPPIPAAGIRSARRCCSAIWPLSTWPVTSGQLDQLERHVDEQREATAARPPRLTGGRILTHQHVGRGIGLITARCGSVESDHL